MKKYIFLSFIFTILIAFLFQAEIKILIRNSVSPDLYQRVSFIKKLVLNQDFGFHRYENVLGETYNEIKDFIYSEEFSFNIKGKETRSNSKVIIFNIPPIFPAVRVNHYNTAYIDFFNDNLIYATKNGIFYKVTRKSKELTFTPFNSNILEFFKDKKIEKNASINYYNSSTISKFGIKDILVNDKDIYVSYIEDFGNDNYNTSILKAKISDSLVFSKHFSSTDYINSNFKEFYPIQSGGRIVDYKKDSLLFSLGEYRYRLKAQDLSSDNGKIIAINKFDGGSRIISYGHRNPQGLDYNKKNKYIISTEHGPNGGDEINFSLSSDKLKNYGWPISSYGYHYSSENAINDSHEGSKNRVVKGAPLYKSHFEHGFVEPIFYWEKSPGVSEVNFIRHKKNYPEFIVSTLGYGTMQNPDSHHLLHYKYDISTKTIDQIARYSINERVRDIKYNTKTNELFFVGESTGVIGILNLN